MNALANHKDNTVCILGLGYVGLTLATVMAEVGFRVHGVEIRQEVLDKLVKGEAHFYEPGLQDRLTKVISQGRITFSRHIPENCSASVYIITVGTPLNEEGKVRLDMIESVSREVVEKMKDGDMVILRSTVKSGTTRSVVLPLIKKKKLAVDVAFCPERTLEGKALSELRYLPQIVGADTEEGGVRAAQLFQFVTPTVVRVSDIETAEIIKLIDNSYRNTNFGFANEVARICDAVGISALEVIQAATLGYTRTSIALPGPVGGPCLEKDPHILAESLESYNIRPEVIMAARRLHENQPSESVAYIYKKAQALAGFPIKDPVITLMGFAFKGRPETDDLRGTMAYPIVKALREYFPQALWRGYDPLVTSDLIEKEFSCKAFPTIEEAMDQANLVVIMNNHPVFERMPIEATIKKMAHPGFVYDFWNNFTNLPLQLPHGTGYVALGSHGKGQFNI